MMHNEQLKAPNANMTRCIRIFILGFSFLVFHFSLQHSARADDSITLPLNGYYHPGRYMPVHVAMAPRNADENEVKLSAPAGGSVWTNLRFDGGPVDTVVPWMAVDPRAQQLSWYVFPRQGGETLDTPLKPLGEHDRLVGWAGVDATAAMEVAQKIYPGDHVIMMPLNPLMPLPGSPAAWDTLDAVVLDPTATDRVGESRFAALVGEGVAFAVRADIPAPFPRWTWQRIGNWHVMHYLPAGPTAVTYNDASYTPVGSWADGWSVEIRRQVAFAGAAFSVVLLLLLLWHPRYTVSLAVFVSFVCLGWIAYFRDHHRPGQTVGGKIRIVTPAITQDDDWAFQTTHQTTYSNIRWVDTTRVVFNSAVQLDRISARIACYPNGDPDYIFFDLPAKAKVALLSRRCGPRAPTMTPSPAVPSPLTDLAKAIYLRPGDDIVGEFPSAPLIGEAYAPIQQWPALLIKRP